jgi:hypothetical protein
VRRLVVVLLVLFTTLAALPGVDATGDAVPATVCARFAPAADQRAALADPELDEVSGLAASRTQPPLLWVHDDSGGAPEVYAVRPDGALVGTYTVERAVATDWEDIAVGPGPERGTSYLYVGDIGDNRGQRDHVTVYRVPEPAAQIAPTGTLTGTAVIELRYPDHPVDAESLFVDPRTGDLFVIDKRLTAGIARVFRAPARMLVDGPTVELREVTSFTLGLLTIVTGADISPDGSTVLVRTYDRVVAFSRPKHGTIAAAFRRPPCDAPQIDEPQGEALGFAANGASYFTISEGRGAAIHRFTVRPRLADRGTTRSAAEEGAPSERPR